MPGRAAGIITFFIVSDLVAPTPKEASLKLCGTEFITSSDNEEMKGIIIMPITRPAASALSEEAASPNDSLVLLINGPTTRAAKKPYTTVGTPANTSIVGLIIFLVFLEAYSDKYIAEKRPTGPAKAIAIIVIRNVPAKTGTAPNEPSAATWPSLNAICGDHNKPKKYSNIVTS